MKIHCPILGRPTVARQTAYSHGEWSIVQCTETGFVFLQNPPSYGRLESEFAWEATAAEQTKSRRRQYPLQKAISRSLSGIKNWLFPRRNRFFTLARHHLPATHEGPICVLDIGCGGGEMLMDLHSRFQHQQRQVIPQGIEISLQLAESANQRVATLGGKVLQDSAIGGTEQLAPGSVDIAIMSSFLEHEAQPLELLVALHHALTDHGAIILKVPNFACWNRHLRRGNWPGFRYPDHVNYFTPQTLSALASQAGLSCRQTFLDTIPSSDNMYAVLKKQPAAESAHTDAPSGATANSSPPAEARQAA